MLARDGEPATVGGDRRGGRKFKGIGTDPTSSRNLKSSQLLYVTDGRDALGTVMCDGGCFVAVDTAGIVIGRFSTLREAARSFHGAAR